jgi:hypothetical protein
MTVHSLVLFENGKYTEISKALDITVHNSLMNPQTHYPVEDNYMTFFFPDDVDKRIVYEYAKAHHFRLIDSLDFSYITENGIPDARPYEPISFDHWVKPESLEGYKMFRIHYWTEKPIHWKINPSADLFVCNNAVIEMLTLCN